MGCGKLGFLCEPRDRAAHLRSSQTSLIVDRQHVSAMAIKARGQDCEARNAACDECCKNYIIRFIRLDH